MSDLNRPVIVALGTANPEFKKLQTETAELIASALNLKPAERRLLKSVYRSTGIQYRHSVLSDYCKSPGEFEFFPNDPHAAFPSTAERMKIYKANALALAREAINDGLSSLIDFKMTEITHLITVSCTGMYAPGLDIEIVHHLGLNTSVKRTAINFMGCYGVFNALKVADALCRSEDAVVLIVSVELCTIHFQKNMTLDHIISNSLFADGAASLLVQSNKKQKKYFTLENFHNDILPHSTQEMAWRIGDYGFDIILSAYVPEVIQTGIAGFTKKLLDHYHLDISDIDFYAIHPGGVKILQACEAALQISPEDNRYSYHILKDYGNMSSATIVFVLKKIWDTLTKQDDQKNIFSCAFGPGLTVESTMLKIHHE